MLRLEALLKILIELVRALLLDELSGRVHLVLKRLRLRRRLRGLHEVRRHLQRGCRRRILDRLSTRA